MTKLNVIGVDLAKNVIQVSVLSPSNRELRNSALTRRKFAEAARRPNVKLAPLKTVEQQGMQAVQRSRELLVHERVALSNHLRGLLMEFGIVIPQGFASLYRQLPAALNYPALWPLPTCTGCEMKRPNARQLRARNSLDQRLDGPLHP